MIRGGRSLVTSPPAFSNDTKKVLVCTGNTVSIFSTSTGLLISELEGHGAEVTSVIVVPTSNNTSASKIICYCWTASRDGTIKYWDFSVPYLMKSIDIKFPIHSMVIPGLLGQPAERNEKSHDLFGYIYTENVVPQGKEPDRLFGQIRKCNLTKSRLAGGITLAETKRPVPIAISPLGDLIGICENHKLVMWEIPREDSDRVAYKKICLHHTKALTTLAFHPSERTVAAGDATGRILIWRKVGYRTSSDNSKLRNGRLIKDEDERPGVRGDDDADSCTTWHWHSAEVNVLFFSSDGAYLFSGGKEGVLVVWQLDTGKKKFLPRIGNPLLHYTSSPDPSLSSISCADNRIHLLKMPSMEILRSISGIKPISKIYQGSSGGVAFDHSAGLIALCTENYCIQLYNLLNDREISGVQVCERNHQPGDELTVIVNLVVISPDGSTMGTVETRLAEEGLGGLITLKFWACSSQSKDYSLSTVVYEPHRDAGVSGFDFHPTSHMSVSSSYGGEFKIWVRSRQTKQNEKMTENAGWTCHAVGSYKNKALTTAKFSPDGSVLAVAAENVITLWDPARNVLVAVIGESPEPITTLSFVGKSEYLVSASQGSNPQVSVWSMSNLCVSWSYKLQAEAVSCSMDGLTFAVLARIPKSSKWLDSNQAIMGGIDGTILLFNVGEPVPIASWFVQKAHGGAIAFVNADIDTDDGTPPEQLLAYINGAQEYLLFNPYNEQAMKHSTARRNAVIEDTGRFGYESLYGELPIFNPEKDQDQPIVLAPSARPWETLFNGPSHNLPPLTKLCSVFLESLLEKRTATVE